MERISTNGEIYVKASTIARELGYTADYVGQLCRGGKVDAQLIGRSWFVNERSIREHKQDRYRSTAAKSRQEIKRAIQNGPMRHASDPKNSAFSYETDTSDLFPVIDESRKRSQIDEASEIAGGEDSAVLDDLPKTTPEQDEGHLEEPEVNEAGEYSVPVRRIEPVAPPKRRRPTPQQGVRRAPAAPHRETNLPVQKKRRLATTFITFLLLIGAFAAVFAVSTGAEQRVVASSTTTLNNSYGFNAAAVHTAAEYLTSFIQR